MQRQDGRQYNELRTPDVQTHFTMHAPGSVLMSTGNTRVLCTAMAENKVPPFLRGQGKGWLTAEYAMLPSSTETRKRRDGIKKDGRSVEIQRLIGRSLRSVIDLDKLGERTIYVDCDVLQADGGTRTAAITGAWIAVQQLINAMIQDGTLTENPVTGNVAAVSVGIPAGGDEPVLDLCYLEDSGAVVDMNVVMTDAGSIIEIQGTGEERPFTRQEMDAMLALAEKGIAELVAVQNEALA